MTTWSQGLKTRTLTWVLQLFTHPALWRLPKERICILTEKLSPAKLTCRDITIPLQSARLFQRTFKYDSRRGIWPVLIWPTVTLQFCKHSAIVGLVLQPVWAPDAQKNLTQVKTFEQCWSYLAQRKWDSKDSIPKCIVLSTQNTCFNLHTTPAHSHTDFSCVSHVTCGRVRRMLLLLIILFIKHILLIKVWLWTGLSWLVIG